MVNPDMPGLGGRDRQASVFTHLLGVGALAYVFGSLHPRKRRLFAFTLMTALFCTFALWASFERDGYLRLQSSMNRGWVTLGEWMASEVRPDETLAIGAAGIVPYYTDLYTIDILGLNDLHIAHLEVPLGAGLSGHEKSDPEYVLTHRPTYIASWMKSDGSFRL